MLHYRYCMAKSEEDRVWVLHLQSNIRARGFGFCTCRAISEDGDLGFSSCVFL